ncbi:UNVERIFIED_CONTAM: hypothetical protein RMT77_017216 [Armadillidium vulgare]
MVNTFLKCAFQFLSLSLFFCAILSIEVAESDHNVPQNEDEDKFLPTGDITVGFADPDWEDLVRRSRVRRTLKPGSEPTTKKPKSKKRESRKKIAISAVEKIVEEKLKEQLRPLETALQIIRLDSFTEGILRQLSSLELIQSKLLTEYGELRAAVSEVGRHTLDLGRQVAGLDERLASLDRQLPHRMDISALRKDFRPDTPSRSSKPYSDASQTTELLKDALVAMTTKITSSERRFKDDMNVLANRTIEALKSTQSFLDRRLSEVAMQTHQISLSFDKVLSNCSCLTANPSPSTPPLLPNSDRFFRHSHNAHKSSTPETSRDDLVYLPAEERSLSTPGRLEREERQHPPIIGPFTGWSRPATSSVAEFQTLNEGTVSRLASEIAKQVAIDGDFESSKDCSDIEPKGEKKSGIYSISPASCSKRYSVKVWCEFDDSSSSSEGWTIIQRRGPWDAASLQQGSSSTSPFSDFTLSSTPPVDFFRDWADYKWGFGNLDGEYWLGNEYIHHLTQSGDYDLRIELYDWGNEMRWAQYSHFATDDELHNYTLHIGEYTGNSGNSLKQHQGAAFSTRDRDNDLNPRGHCARTFHGAWWFTSCHESHLNGRYHKGRHKIYGDGINWLAFRGHNYSLKRSRMMIRPSDRNLN